MKTAEREVNFPKVKYQMDDKRVQTQSVWLPSLVLCPLCYSIFIVFDYGLNFWLRLIPSDPPQKNSNNKSVLPNFKQVVEMSQILHHLKP